jgi:hypothetical protein
MIVAGIRTQEMFFFGKSMLIIKEGTMLTIFFLYIVEIITFLIKK